MMKCPPLDGSVCVLPGFTDFQAKHNPDKPCFTFSSRRSSNETSSVSFLEFAQATHRVAHTLRPGRRGSENQVVAILASCDTLLYVALIVGSVRAGLVPFPMSPKNSPEAIQNMLRKTDCHRILAESSLSVLLSNVQACCSSKGYSVQVNLIPPLDLIFPQPAQASSHSDVENPYPEAQNVQPDDPVFYLHSSGSTGFPKPIPQTGRKVLQRIRLPLMEETAKHQVIWATMTLLTFHTIGFFLQVYVPMTTGLPVAIYTPQSPAPPILPNPLNVLELVKLLGCNGVLVMPSIIEIWTQSEESVAFLTTLQALMYGGGPLSAENGDKLVAAGVKLCTLYGATEFGTPIRILDTEYSKSPDPGAKTPEDWAWLQFSSLTQPKWVDQGDGTFELQLLNCDTHEPNVENMENPRGYATSDLFISHPTKKGLWRLVGRADDVVVLSSGEKIVPVPQQNFLVSTKYASGALIFGRGETQAGVLIEPRSEFVVDPDDEKALMDFKNMIWPCVDAANKLAPSFARIFKEMIIITKPSKPMIRAAKGTVMRKLTLAAYEIEISNLYGKDIGTSGNSITGPESWASKDVLTWLTLQAESIHHREEVDPGRDLFEQGFDSLSATFLRNRIIGALRCYKRNDETAFAVPPSFVFMYPTLQDLAVATVNLLSTNGATQNGHVGASSVRDIHTSLNKYLSLLPGLFPLVPRTSEDGAVVLLTGSTGSLGSHILAGLLSDERVARVFAFNRENSRFKQVAAFAERGLPVELLSSRKLLEIVGNSSKDDLGLEDRVLTEIKTSVTHIIHNAWKVDFNLSLQSFDTQIAGASNFIKLCALSSQSVKFFFTSSIGVARNWDSGRSGSVPEDVMHDANVAAGQGYAASKYVVEQLLEKARERGLSATSIRLGQISGSSKTGSWPATEWFPILIKSSIALGCLPTQENAITWVPVDIVAQTIVDYVHAATDSPNGLPIVLNLVHHRPSSWNTIIDAINDALPSRLLLLPFSEWVKKIESVNTSSAPDVLGQVPAAKLLDFFRGLAKSSVSATKQGTASHFVTAQSQRFSLALRDAQVISTENAALWIRYWKEIDFLAARGHA